MKTVVYRLGGLGVQPPPPHEIPKALQNRAKLGPIVKCINVYVLKMTYDFSEIETFGRPYVTYDYLLLIVQFAGSNAIH